MKHPAILAALLIGCTDTRDITLTPELEAVVDSNNAFAVDLYQRAAADSENVIFSPLSISAVLSMTLAGAAGQTAAEMSQVLHITDEDHTSYHQNFGDLMQDLDGKFDGYSIHVANRLYGAEGMTWKDGFLGLTGTDYGASLEELNFSKTDRARGKINRWVARQTGGMIDELLEPGLLQPSTVLVLANAIYFQGDWADAFDEGDTKQKSFTTLDGSERPVQMMSVNTTIGYTADGTVRVGRLPYEGGETSLFIVLPEEEDGLEAVEQVLTVEQIDAWDEALIEHSVDVELPRLTIESRLELGDMLREMGMPSAFDPSLADFSAMADSNLYLDFVVHEAIVEIEETGTEAAAATAAGMRFTADPEQTIPFELIADHPFLFFIRDDLSGVILFAGRVMAP